MTQRQKVIREPLAKFLVSTVFEIAENPKLLIRRALSKPGICERAAIGHDSGILQEARVATMASQGAFEAIGSQKERVGVLSDFAITQMGDVDPLQSGNPLGCRMFVGRAGVPKIVAIYDPALGWRGGLARRKTKTPESLGLPPLLGIK